jgi:hypothetical protein
MDIITNFKSVKTRGEENVIELHPFQAYVKRNFLLKCFDTLKQDQLSDDTINMLQKANTCNVEKFLNYIGLRELRNG